MNLGASLSVSGTNRVVPQLTNGADTNGTEMEWYGLSKLWLVGWTTERSL